MRRKLLSILIALLFAAAAVAAVELGLRFFAPIHTVGVQEGYEYDAELGYRLKAGQHLLRVTDYQQEIRTNALGTANFQEAFRQYPNLVFVLGDSFTQGSGLPADASYPSQLDLILNRDERDLYRPRYGVVNLGLEGSGGEQALILLRRYASRLGPPAFVLYMGTDNDYEDDLVFTSGQRRRHLVDGSPYWGWLVRPLRWFANTNIGIRIRLASAMFRRRRALRSIGIEPFDPDRSPRSAAELQQPVLERIAAACRQYNARLVVTWTMQNPASYKWLQSWARLRQIAFADWSPAVESVQSSVPAMPLYNPHSGGHFRPWVNRLIAEEFARQILSPAP
jgi:hypothetical protein